MEPLEYIKKIELEVAQEVEKIRIDSDSEVKRHRERSQRSVDAQFSEVLKKYEGELSKAKAEAGKKATLTLNEAERQIIQIKNSSNKNTKKAVTFIINTLGG